jgi:hypothetical protein
MNATDPISCTTDDPVPAPYQALRDAAAKLLEARQDQMVTGAEWESLEQALVACQPSLSPMPDVFDITHDFLLTQIEQRDQVSGTWVKGNLAGYRFSALVFDQHVSNRDWELGESQISKLSIQRNQDHKVVYNWDRGLDIPATEPGVQTIVDSLTEGLKDCVNCEQV